MASSTAVIIERNPGINGTRPPGKPDFFETVQSLTEFARMIPTCSAWTAGIILSMAREKLVRPVGGT
jgi:hypothetical protein